MSHLSLDARAILEYLNELGYRNITASQLKEFMKDLRKLIKYEEHFGWSEYDYLQQYFSQSTTRYYAKVRCNNGQVEISKQSSKAYSSQNNFSTLPSTTNKSELDTSGYPEKMPNRSSSENQKKVKKLSSSEAESKQGTPRLPKRSRSGIKDSDMTSEEKSSDAHQSKDKHNVKAVTVGTTDKVVPNSSISLKTNMQSKLSYHDAKNEEATRQLVQQLFVGTGLPEDTLPKEKKNELATLLTWTEIQQRFQDKIKKKELKETTANTRDDMQWSQISGKKAKDVMIPRFQPKARMWRPNFQDPVALYHWYQKQWKNFHSRIPGENDRSDLRWQLRQKFLDPDPIVRNTKRISQALKKCDRQPYTIYMNCE